MLLDRERNKYLTVLHCILMPLWVIPFLALVGALFGITSATTLKPFSALVILAALVLGVYASIAYLRRPDRQ